MNTTLTVSLNMILLPFLVVFLVPGMMVSYVASAESDTKLPAPSVVKDVDLNRYLGRWYEIALIPVWFQKECAGGTTAEYTLVKEGVVSVVNRCCTRDGKVKEAKGRAWVVDMKTPAKLKVSFFSLFGVWLFAGHYWIIDLDPEYQYAVIGHPSRNLGWILSRTPKLPDEVLKGIVERLEANGYTFSQFKMTNQTDFSCTP
jgi:apolipoprotein D and lipocalin family protein